mgnify:CR=1 FL=1
MKKTIVCVVGTRPEAIKMAPVILALKADADFDVKVLATGQHAEMLDSVLDFFNIIPDTNLHVMKARQGLEYITSSVLTMASDYLRNVNPSAVLVHGDTTTTFAAALAAFYLKIPVGHVEAGLRSFTLSQPFPEELNRVLVDKFANWAFAPTELSKQNLLNENFPASNIVVTGNTVIDALLCAVQRVEKPKIEAFNRLPEDTPFILLTAHRRESWGKPLESICNSVKFLLKNLIKIAYDFMSGCEQFNQPLDLGEKLISILDGFLMNCYSFNQSLTLPNNLQLVGNSFLLNCYSMESTVNIQKLSVNIFNPTTNIRTLTSGKNDVPMITQGVKIAGTNAEEFIKQFPTSTDKSPFRKLINGN